MVGGHGQVRSRHVDSYSFFFFRRRRRRRRRRRFLPIFLFFFYFYYYKIMIMTIMIMKTIMSVFNLIQNAYPKRKCAYNFVRC